MVNLLDDVFKNTTEEVRERKEFKLPAIVTIVLYNGEGNLTPVQSFKEYTANYGDFGDNIIDFKYLLFDLNRQSEEDILTTHKLLDFVFDVDLKRNLHSTEDFHRVTQKLAGLSHELTEDDVKTFISWFNRAILKGSVDEKLEKEAVAAFVKGEVKPMSYAVDRLIEKERKEESNIQAILFAKKLLKRGRPIEEIAEDSGLTRDEIEKLRA